MRPKPRGERSEPLGYCRHDPRGSLRSPPGLHRGDPMSRAYKIKVSERARHTLRAGDRVSTQLALLEILPCERMAELLAAELQKRGFIPQGDALVRRESDGVVIEVDPESAAVTVRIETEKTVTIEGELTGWSGSADGKQQEREKANLRKQLLQDLQRQAEAGKAGMQKQVTDLLESRLADLRKELDAAVNRVTADALKEKAAQIGQIKELSEDAATGSLTIVLEV